MPLASEKVRKALFQSMESAFLDEKVRVNSLVMLSGGLDSVALLVNLLEHTNHRIHAHHVEIANSERRVHAENQALEGVLAFLRRDYRKFTYSTSKCELMLGTGGGTDMTLTMFMAARVTIATGCTTELVWTGHYSQTATQEIAESSAVFAACFANIRYKPVWMMPFRHCLKLDVYGSIPRELADMTWSCRTPLFENQRFSECGQCHACETRARTLAELD